eukprot:g72310.t1
MERALAPPGTREIWYCLYQSLPCKHHGLAGHRGQSVKHVAANTRSRKAARHLEQKEDEVNELAQSTNNNLNLSQDTEQAAPLASTGLSSPFLSPTTPLSQTSESQNTVVSPAVQEHNLSEAAMARRLVPQASASTVHPIRKEDGTMATTQTERLDTVTRYRAKLGAPLQNPSFDETFRTTIEARMVEHLRDSVTQAEIDLDGEFTLEELEECLEQAQFGKACGSDETRNEMFKCGGATMRQLLLRAFVWLHGRETVRGTRGLSSEPVHNGPNNLIARGSGTQEVNETQYLSVFFVDFRKAFDTVWQDGLWERLWQSGIRGRAWRIIRDAYRGIRMRVLVDGCLTQPVPVSQGVRQGDPLSPVLFLIFIDALAEMLAERCKGLAYSPEGPATRRQLRSLLYADDVVMLAESPEELNAMIEVVRSFCDTWRIEINLTKSQVMEVHPRGVCRKAEGYYYGSKAIEVVKQYKYLGLMLTNTLSWDAHHERALAKAAKARKGHVALARLFARREIPFAAKRAMWTTTTLSSLEYGAERDIRSYFVSKRPRDQSHRAPDNSPSPNFPVPDTQRSHKRTRVEPSDCIHSKLSASSQPATQPPSGGGVEWMPMSSDMQS